MMENKFKYITGFCALMISGVLIHHMIPQDGAVVEQQTDSTPIQREIWLKERLVDPATGEIPVGMRQKELMFAQTIPAIDDFGSRSGLAEKLTYTQRGPGNVGGRTRALGIDRSNSAILLAGAVSGGVYRSEDYGDSWKRVSDIKEGVNVTCIAQDPRAGKKQIWYYGTGEGGNSSVSASNSATLLGNGLYKSTDNGKTWEHLSSTKIEKVNLAGEWGYTWKIAIDPSNAGQDEVYVAANGVIKKSIDGGDSWKTVLGGINSNNSHYTDIKVTNTGVVYAAIANQSGQKDPGLWRSEDGDNWVKITPAAWPGNFQRVVLDFAEFDDKHVYFLARTPGTGTPATPGSGGSEYTSLFKYTYLNGDGTGTGGNWVNLSNNIPSHNNTYYTFDSQGNYNLMITVDPADANIVYIGANNLFRSTDGFTSKLSTTQIGGYNPEVFTDPTQYRYPNQHPDQHGVVFGPSNSSNAYSITDGGVSYTNDIKATKVVWQFKNRNYFSSQFYTVAIDHQTKNNVVLGGLQDNGTQFTASPSSDDNWTDPQQSDGAYCAVVKGSDASGAGTYYVSTQYGRTYKIAIDGNGNKTATARVEFGAANPNNRSASYEFINPFTLDYADNNVMYMAYKNGASGPSKVKVHRNLKNIILNGANFPRTDWAEMNYTFGGRIATLKTSRKNPEHILYVGTTNGRMYRVENANGSAPTITDISDIPGFSKGTYVSDIAVHPEDGRKIIAVFSNYNVYSIFYSEDGGDSWTGIAGNLEDPLAPGLPQLAKGLGNGPSVRSAAILETKSGTAYFVGTSTGLYATATLNDDETVWVKQSADLIGNAIVEKMDTRDVDNYLAVATHGNGVFGVEVDDAKRVEETAIRELETVTLNLYPNPATNAFTIDLNQGSELTQVTLYNESGQQVKQVPVSLNGSSAMVDVSDLSRGIYYVAISDGRTELTKKVIVQ